METIQGNFAMWLVNKIEHWAVFESIWFGDGKFTKFRRQHYQLQKPTTKFSVPFQEFIEACISSSVLPFVSGTTFVMNRIANAQIPPKRKNVPETKFSSQFVVLIT